MSLDVQAHDLYLDYWGTEALRGLSFHVEAGTICGLLGRNGSGKTTLMSLLAALRRPSSGEVRIGGQLPYENAGITGQVALVGEAAGKSSVHSVKDVLEMAAVLRAGWDGAYAERLRERFDVPRRSKVGALSRGKRAALSAICGLASRAPLTMFDEAHLGMDVPSRYAFYDELLADYLARPRTILLSTHHIDEVASLFAEVVILHEGRLLAQADTDGLRSRGTEITGPADAVDRFTAGLTVLSKRQLGGTEAVVTYGELTDEQHRRARAQGLELGPIPLQDLFVHLTSDNAIAEPDEESTP